jgi:hypothetical protein
MSSMNNGLTSDPDVLQRIRAEYLEMPGLKLTAAQAQRLWNLNRTTCEGLLGRLVDAKFLLRTRDGAFVRFDSLSAH